MIRRALTVLAIALVAACAGGCLNPFQPATPQVSNSGGVAADYSTTEKLLQTLAEAIQDKSAGGRTAYNDALADSIAFSTHAFYAFPYPAVRDLWTNPTDPWDIVFEKRFYDYLIGVKQNFKYTFDWGADNTSSIDEETAERATLHRHYKLVARSSDGLVEQTIAIGYADLYLQKLNGRWYLYRWEDRIDPAVGVVPADANQWSMGWRRFDSSH